MSFKIETYATRVGVAPSTGVSCVCGKVVSADMLRYVGMIPKPRREALGIAGSDYICDGCHWLANKQGFTLHEFHAAQGAPVDVLNRAKRLDNERAIHRHIPLPFPEAS